MVKTNELFKVQYVAPKVKEFEVKVQSALLNLSNGIDDIDGDDVQDNTSRWGY